MTPGDIRSATQEAFIEYFMIFSKVHTFTPSLAPFANRKYVPEWFKREFHSLTPEHETEATEILEALLTPRILSSRIGNTKDTMGLVGCQPNLVSL